MKTSIRLLAVATSALVLGACSSIGNKSADEMVRYAVQHNLTRDNQYNFEGKMFVQEVDVPAAQAASAALADTAVAVAAKCIGGGDECTEDTASANAAAANAAAAVDAASAAADAATAAAAADAATAAAAAVAVAEDTTVAETEPVVSAAETEPVVSAEKKTEYSQWMRHWMRSVSVPYTGAVDLPAGKIELIPELRYDTRNAMVSIKLPMQININDLSLLADPAAVAPFVDMFASDSSMQPLGDKLVRVGLPEEWRKHIPMQSILAAVPKALDDGYAALDKQAYQKLDMYEDGRKVGARYRVGLDTTLKQSNQLAAAMMESLRSQLAETAKNNPQAGISAEDYKSTIEALAWVAKLYTNPGDTEMEQILGAMKTHTDYYLDGRGRIVAMRQNMTFPPLLSVLMDSEKNYQVTSWWRLNYTGKPTFTLHATPQNTQNLTQIFPYLGTLMGVEHKPAAPSEQVQALQDLEYELEGVTVTVE